MRLRDSRYFGLAALAVTAGALFTACPPAEGEGEAEQVCPTNRRTCDSDRVCAGGFCDKEHDSADAQTGDGIATADDNLGCCVILVCSTDADCDDNERCDVRRGICVPLGLCDPALDNGGSCLQRDGSTKDCCQSGQFCEYTDGQPVCVDTPPAATDCFVSAGGRPLATAPGDTEAAPAVVSDGNDLQLEALGTDAAGKIVPHSTFTWSGDGVDAATGVLTGTCAADVCQVTVTATAENGGASCTGVVNVYAAPTLAHRIVVLDQATGEPVQNALAAAAPAAGGAPLSANTNADGAAEFDGDILAISAFPDDYQWQTIMNPPADVVVYTNHLPDNTKVAGISGTFNFDDVHTTGDIRLGLSGTAISSAITDLNFNTLIGEIADYNVELQGITDPGGQLVPLPSGIVIELGTSPIKGDFVTFGDPGKNIAWAIGGQVALADVGPIITGVAGGGDVNVGNILGGVLPFFAKFDHAVLTGLDLQEKGRPRCDNGGFTCAGTDTCDAAKGTCVTADGDDVPVDTAAWGFDDHQLDPNTLLSQSVDYAIPTLPCVPGQFSGGSCTDTADGASGFQTGAVLLSGVIVPGIGLVPLGLTAGLDDPDDKDTVDQADGKLDTKAGTVGAPASGHAIIDYAPPHDGLEGNTFISVAIALDLNTITDGGGLGASIVTNVTRKFGGDNNFPATNFLQAQGGTFHPDSGTGDGTFAMSTVGDGAQFWRVNFDDGGDVEWNVWFDDPAQQISVTALHPDAAAAAARFKHADVQAFRLGAGYADIGLEPVDYADLFTFNGTNLDNLLYYLGAWSSQACSAGAVCNQN